MCRIPQKHARSSHVTNERKADGDGPKQKKLQTRANEGANEGAPDRLATLGLASWSCGVLNVYARVSGGPCAQINTLMEEV